MLKWEWTYDSMDSGRLKRSKQTTIIPGTLDQETGSAVFQGSSGTHKTTLHSCTCVDFCTRSGAAPCKHIIRLGLELGLIDENGYTSEERIEANTAYLKEQIACAYGMYHIFHEPIVSKQEYDEMCFQYHQMTGISLNHEAPLPSAPAKTPEEESSALSFAYTGAFITWLRKNHIPYRDHRASGGRLWIRSTPSYDEFLRQVTVAGKAAKRVEQSRAFNKNPGWFV